MSLIVGGSSEFVQIARRVLPESAWCHIQHDAIYAISNGRVIEFDPTIRGFQKFLRSIAAVKVSRGIDISAVDVEQYLIVSIRSFEKSGQVSNWRFGLPLRYGIPPKSASIFDSSATYRFCESSGKLVAYIHIASEEYIRSVVELLGGKLDIGRMPQICLDGIAPMHLTFEYQL